MEAGRNRPKQVMRKKSSHERPRDRSDGENAAHDQALAEFLNLGRTGISKTCRGVMPSIRNLYDGGSLSGLAAGESA